MLDETTLKLHTDEAGLVWYAAGCGPPACSSVQADRFLEKLFGKESSSGRLKFRRVRMMGVVANAELLLVLYETKAKIGLGSLQVCTPLAVPDAQSRKDPREVLFSLKLWDGRVPSQGGWHEFDSHDYLSYQLALCVARQGPSEAEKTLLLQHPMWPCLSFITGVSQPACCQLLSLVLDPRFYIDPAHPDRIAKLEAYLGLTKATQEHVSAGRLEGRLHGRCLVVMTVWKDPLGSRHQPPADYLHDPGAFLWRVWAHHGGGAHGDLKASQNLAAFLRHTWLGVLYEESIQPETLFVPAHFFSRPEDVLAFKEHIASMRTGRK